MTIEEKRRELFSEFVAGHVGEEVTAVEFAWVAFNAALDAVVITLPDTYQLGGFKCGAHPRTLIACRAAIESTGLGLKVLP